MPSITSHGLDQSIWDRIYKIVQSRYINLNLESIQTFTKIKRQGVHDLVVTVFKVPLFNVERSVSLRNLDGMDTLTEIKFTPIEE